MRLWKHLCPDSAFWWGENNYAERWGSRLSPWLQKAGERQRDDRKRIYLLNTPKRPCLQVSQRRLYSALLLLCGQSSLWKARPDVERKPGMKWSATFSKNKKLENMKMKSWTVPGGPKRTKIIPHHCQAEQTSLQERANSCERHASLPRSLLNIGELLGTPKTHIATTVASTQMQTLTHR